MKRALLTGLLGTIALFFSTAPALAAYPPGTSIFLGSYAPGQGANTVLVGYGPGSTVNFQVNGAPDGAGTAAGDGTLGISISVTDPHVAVNGNTPISVNYGIVTITANGTDPTGQPITDTATLNVLQGITSTSTSIPGGTTQTTTSSVTTVPAASGGTTTPNTTTAPASSSNSLAFTGADIAAMVIGGVALVALGTLLVVFTRRRSRRNQKLT